MKSLKILFLLLAAGVANAANTYYVSPTGNSSNTGLSTSSPWSLTYALAHVSSGDTLRFMDGNYPSIDITTSGITLMAENKWKARVIGSAAMHGIATEDNINNVVIDGFEVDHSYIDGVKFNGHNSTLRNCWIHDSGKGDPASVTNNTGSYTGMGVAAHAKTGTLIEYNLLEKNGLWYGHDHGIYASGTNVVIRGNVSRNNASYGIQLYESSPSGTANAQVYNNLIYNNGTLSANSGIVLYTYNGQTNYIYNNTIIETNNVALNFSGGVVFLTNNIIASNGGSLDQRSLPTTYFADYNVSTIALNTAIRGAHDVVSSSLMGGFVSTNTGLFWLKSSSPARSVAKTTVFPPIDFFGATQTSSVDCGAFQYNANQADDNRTLDPSPTFPNYWLPFDISTAGNVLSAQVLPSGDQITVQLAGLVGDTGTWNFGWGGTNHAPAESTPTVVLTTSVPGYDSAGNVTQRTRTIHGTIQARKAYPNDSVDDVTNDGVNTTIKIFLSETITTGDFNVRLVMASGVYTSGLNVSAAFNNFIANNSTVVPPKVIANWSYPGRDLVNNGTLTLRVKAYHMSAGWYADNNSIRAAEPVACVRFTVTDGVNTAVQTVPTSSICNTPDAVPVNEYVANFNTSLFANGLVTANFTAYPWIGNSMTSGDSLYTLDDTPFHAPTKFWVHTGANQKGCVALVSPSGNDSTGVVVSQQTYNGNNLLTPFLTMAKALSAMAAFNNGTFGRNTLDASTLLLDEGSYTVFGSTQAAGYGTENQTYVTIKAKPGARRDFVILTDRSGNSLTGQRVKFQNVTFRATTGTGILGANKAYWMDQCIIDHTISNCPLVEGGAGFTSWYVTDCDIRAINHGLRPFSTQKVIPAIVRGNRLPKWSSAIMAYTVLGNWKYGTGTAATILYDGYTGMTIPNSTEWIIAENKFEALNVGGNSAISIGFGDTTWGGVFAQNVVEVFSGSSPAISMYEQNVTTTADNILVWHNTVVGQRWNGFYDWDNNVLMVRKRIALVGNYFDDYNIKSDNNATGGNLRVGNWEPLNGVNFHGNTHGQITNVGVVSKTFIPRFGGVDCYVPAGSAVNVNNWPAWATPKSQNSSGVGTGDGIYALRSTSPVAGLIAPSCWVLPYDIAGQPRAVGRHVSGAYAGIYNSSEQTTRYP